MHPALRLDRPQPLPGSTLLLALTGWMDGGLVSTGTVGHLMQGQNLVDVGEIDSAGFYIDSIPASMEVAAMFRPTVRYKNGLIESFESTTNRIAADAEHNLVYFVGKEPNLNWRGFADCIFEAARILQVKRIVFVGSFGGTVPHTRQPRLYGAVSDLTLLPLLKQFNLRATEYEGPASFATMLLNEAKSHDLEMLSIAVEIPGYLQGPNPMSIEAVARRMAAMLGIRVDLDPLREQASEWEIRVTEMVQADEELARTVAQLESDYDAELVKSME